MKILLADDHILFRDALVQYITRAQSSAKVSVAKDFHEALAIMESDSGQSLVLLDLRMPGMNGMEGLRILREKYPDTPVALMSGVAEESDVRKAMDMGAAAYFPKTLSGKMLVGAIQQVLAGGQFLPVDHKTKKIMPSYYSDQPKAVSVPETNLTPREKEVLQYLVKGETNKTIAVALDLQVVTVKLHVRGICRKLEAKNRTQAALKAREMGIAS